MIEQHIFTSIINYTFIPRQTGLYSWTLDYNTIIIYKFQILFI